MTLEAHPLHPTVTNATPHHHVTGPSTVWSSLSLAMTTTTSGVHATQDLKQDIAKLQEERQPGATPSVLALVGVKNRLEHILTRRNYCERVTRVV